MLNCLSTGVNGLSANNNDMSVIANNIANANTPGYKTQRAEFSDILYQQTGKLEFGNGVSICGVSSVLSQGPLTSTNNLTDMAIDGAGYFIVKDDAGEYYTRAGQFHINEEGKLVTPEGRVVQGWNLQESGGMASPPSDLNVSNISVSPHATENVAVKVNLKSDDPVSGGAAFDPADPAGTSSYPVSLTVYDSLGDGHNLTFYFRKQADNQWEWHAFEGQTSLNQSGSLTFTNDGVLDSTTPGTGTITTSSGQAIAVDFGGSTQHAADLSSTISFSQDGYEAGSMSSFAITREGIIQGIITNGRREDIARIALADFHNPNGLMHMGNNLFLATPESGQPVINAPETGGKGSIASYNLENSNVDLAAEFVRMIITQRAFQANARTITTADQLLTELVNLKR